MFALCVLGKSCGFSSGSFSFANLVAKPKQRAIHEHVTTNIRLMNRITISKYLIILFSLSSFFSCIQKDKSSKESYKVFTNHIQLQGEDNFRDLGGFVGQNGRRVLYRKLYRSGELVDLTDSDKDSLSHLGIEQIIDLRTTLKRKEAPDNIPNGISNYHYPLLEYGNSKELGGQILSGQVDAEELMLSIYGEIDSLKIANWTKIFDLLEDNKVTLWHCSAGKDRAGMTTALVLASLGVEERAITDDFMTSNNFLSIWRNNIYSTLDSTYGKQAKELFRPFIRVEEEYIEAFSNTIKKEYGSIEEFLVVLDVDTEKMQENYLEK